MDRLAHFFSVAIVVSSVTACTQSDSYTVEDPLPVMPKLQDFYIVDSDGYRSDRSPSYESVIDPKIDGGLFEVYWLANSFYDYRVTLSLNDQPSMFGSFILSEEYCGAGLSCDFDGMQMCQYTLDGYLGCGSDLHEVDRNFKSIDPLLVHFPEYLYLNIEICDEKGLRCVVDSQEVVVF